MQAGGGRAPGVPGREHTEHVTGPHRLSTMDGRDDGLVGRPQPTRMVDAHDAPPRDRAGEVDDTGTRGPHRNPGRGREIDTAMAGQPRLGRRLEPADHRGRAVERPPEPDDRRALRIGKQSKRPRRRRALRIGKQSK